MVDQCRGRRVIHLGFGDVLLFETRFSKGEWLHGQIAAVCSSLVGIDIVEHAVAWARKQGYDAHRADVQSSDEMRSLGLAPADVIVAGELIEHLESPGLFLRAMHVLAHDSTRLIVTTPNAYRVLNFAAPLAGVELVHPEHTAWYSHRTLRVLLERCNWCVEWCGYYQDRRYDLRTPVRGLRLLGHGANLLRRGMSLVGRWAPHWSDGLLVVARPDRPPTRS